MHNLKRVWTYLVIVAVAMLAALNYELFVFPNSFAPSGLNGICTIIQYVSGISVGYMSLCRRWETPDELASAAGKRFWLRARNCSMGAEALPLSRRQFLQSFP